MREHRPLSCLASRRVAAFRFEGIGFKFRGLGFMGSGFQGVQMLKGI